MSWYWWVLIYAAASVIVSLAVGRMLKISDSWMPEIEDADEEIS